HPPIAQENKHAPNLPNDAPHNNNPKLYTDLMADVAKQRGVPFVDLFTPSLKMFSETPKSLTIDTVHLTDEGNHLLAPLIIHAVFSTAVTARHETASLGKIRTAVLDKNFYWFNRYRTVDGYNVYGGRSQLKYVEDVSNWDVLQREMEVLDVMTANRDKRIWAAARGKNLAVDDSNTPPQLPVKSNKP